ncbi:MAG TPA: hypothetical protein VG965_03180 [Patescibacteria group bacterium]|nr:hypothetical protein [Patescibacteria group bacterium]
MVYEDLRGRLANYPENQSPAQQQALEAAFNILEMNGVVDLRSKLGPQPEKTTISPEAVERANSLRHQYLKGLPNFNNIFMNNIGVDEKIIGLSGTPIYTLGSYITSAILSDRERLDWNGGASAETEVKIDGYILDAENALLESLDFTDAENTPISEFLADVKRRGGLLNRGYPDEIYGYRNPYMLPRIKTVGHFTMRTESEIESNSNFGTMRMEETRKRLTALGLAFATETLPQA